MVTTGGPYVVRRKSSIPTWAILASVAAVSVVMMCGGLFAFTAIAMSKTSMDIDVVEVYTDTSALGTEYTAVSVRVTNQSHKSLYVGPRDWYVLDEDGVKHEAVYGPFSTRDDRLPGMRIERDETTAGVFHVEGVVSVESVAYQRWRHEDPVVVQVE